MACTDFFATQLNQAPEFLQRSRPSKFSA